MEESILSYLLGLLGILFLIDKTNYNIFVEKYLLHLL